MQPTNPSALGNILRVLAVAMAVGVVGYLVWRAQVGAEPERARSAAPLEQVAPSDLPQHPPSPVEADRRLLPDVLPPNLVFMPSSKTLGPDTLRPASKLSPLPTPPPRENELMYSSKFGPPLSLEELRTHPSPQTDN